MYNIGLFITVVLIFLAGFFPVQTVEPQEQRVTLTGIVVMKDNTLIQGALVRLSPGAYTDSTDASGQFTLTGISPGNYMLQAVMPLRGLEDVYLKVKIPREEKTQLKIVMYERSYRIDEVIVLSTRDEISKEVKKLPSFVTVVERSEFENKATTVADVIMATPSANISVMGGLGDYTEVSLRGSYSNQVQVYIDGMLLNDAIGGSVNLGTIPLTQVESIEVWRSGAPAQFGGDAVGGVVNIKTRNTNTTQKTFSFGYGSFNTLKTDIVLNIPFGMSRILTSIDYSSSDNDFEYKSDNGTMYNKDDDYRAYRNNDEYRSANLLSKYNHIFKNGILLELSEHMLSSKKNLPGKDNIRHSHASLKTTKNLFQAKMTLNPFLNNEVMELTPRFYHVYNYERYKDPYGNVGWGVQDNIYITQTFNFMVPFTVKFREYATFNFTSTVKHESFRPEHKLQKTIPLSCDREQYAFVFDTVFKTPGERLTLTSNIRKDRFFSYYNGQFSGQDFNTPKPTFNHMTNTHIGAKLRLWDSVSIQCNYGDVTRIPSFYELFGDRGGALSNPKLKPERIYRWDVGARVWLRKEEIPITGSFECVYFENNFQDLIQWYTNDAGFISPDNVGGSYVKGTEIIWSNRILNHIVCSGSWTFQKSYVTSEKRKYYRNKQLPNRPKHFGNIKIECPFKRFVPFWSFNRKGSYYLDRANQNHKKYPGRTLHDAGLSVSLMSGGTTFSIQVKNILDVHTFDYQGMPKPGRSYMATVMYTME